MTSGKVLALDYGKKRVGIATGYFEDRIAFPRGIFVNNGMEGLIADILKFCEEMEVEQIVVGLPLNMEGDVTDNEMVREVRSFVSELREALGERIKVDFFDERLSSFEAGEAMRDYGPKKKNLHRDAFAAKIILERYFDDVA